MKDVLEKTQKMLKSQEKQFQISHLLKSELRK